MLIEAHTLRLRGHAAYDTGDYLQSGESDGFFARDPLPKFRAQLAATLPGFQLADRDGQMKSLQDWPNQALCYLPRNLPEPNSREFLNAMLDEVWPVLEASKGRAFLLFTSHRALREAAEQLREGPWPLFVQGTAPRSVLLERFRASGNGVLLGAASFWEGVDVAGEALSVVVIDRLPFASPGDPVLEARLEAVRRRGGNPFRDEQLPQAVIALKQGVGRLIRSDNDRGVLVLCDPRLLGKPYGRSFLASLPPFPRTRDIEDVQAFFGDAENAPHAAQSTP